MSDNQKGQQGQGQGNKSGGSSSDMDEKKSG